MKSVTLPENIVKTEDLINLAETYAAHRGHSLATISTYAARDGKFFGRLKNGSGCTLRRAGLIVAWFSQNWPDDLAWPSDIPRPKPSKKEVK